MKLFTNPLFSSFVILSLLTQGRNSEGDEETVIIDVGCIKEKPALCPDMECHEDYSTCKPLKGCTSMEEPFMCPDGSCSTSLMTCSSKSYDCNLESMTRCADGVCRERCEGVVTNGCPSHSPLYCPTGKCVKFLAECTDYRCTFQKPFMCANTDCKSEHFNCMQAAYYSMISEYKTSKSVSRFTQSKLAENFYYDSENQEKAGEIEGSLNDIYPSVFTAKHMQLDIEGIIHIQQELKMSPVAFSKIRGSRLRVEDFDLESEKLSNYIYSKNLKNLEPFEFIMSAIVNITIDNYNYNHFIAQDFFSLTLTFNKISAFPDFDELPEEKTERETNIQTVYNIADPSKYYCLAIYSEIDNDWRCISRNIEKINDQSITFRTAFFGTLCVIFMPENNELDDVMCGFLCQFKKEIFITLFLILPAAYVILSWLYLKFVKVIKFASNKFQSKKNAEDPLFKELLDEIREEGFEERQELQVNKPGISEFIKEDNFEVKGEAMTYINPTYYIDSAQANEGDIALLEANKIKAIYLNEQLLADKLKVLRKVSILYQNILDIKSNMENLKKFIETNELSKEKKE